MVTSGKLKKYFPLKAQWFNKELASAICVLSSLFIFEIAGERVLEGHSFIQETLVIGGALCIIFVVIGIRYKGF